MIINHKPYNMRKLLLSVLCIAAAVAPLSARTLTPEEALQRAAIGGTGIATVSLSSQPTLVETRMSLGMPVYYVFSTGTEGFKILSADDNGAPVLGFSDTGTFDPANVPPSLQYMLDCYAEEIAAAAQAPAPAAGVAMRVNVNRESIAPMVDSRWNQGEPYYNMTPTDGGKHCVTGCTATALAQVMYYHKWPEKGQGSITYTADKLKQTLTMNFADATFDWENMADIYNNTSTEAQKNAVALLMKAVGYSLQMNYGTGESGAYSQYAAVGVWKYFGYDKGASIYYRNLYGIGEWEGMIYNNLRDCGPVLYSGFTNPLPGKGSGGHSFVCDGYDSATGLFHINWGWGGMSDGYFALTGLDPGAQGIGGSDSGYNKDQVVILGIRKPADNKEQEPIFGYTSPLEIAPLNEPTRCGFNVYWVGMLSAQESLTGCPGVKVEHPNGQVEYLKATQRTYTNQSWWAAYGYGWYITGWADGKHKIYPVFTTDNGATWQETMYPVGTPRYAILVKTGTKVEVDYPAQATISADDLEYTALYTDRPYEVKAKLTNDSDFEYYRSLRVAFTLDGDVKTSSQYALVDVLPHSTSEMVVQSTLSDLAAGEYEMCVIDEDDIPISSSITVTVGTASAPKFNLMSQGIVTNLGMQGMDPLVNGKEFHVKATIECTEGYYGGSFYAYVFPGSGTQSIAGFSSPTIYMGKGEKKTVDITGSIDGLVEGRKYFAIVYAMVDNSWVQLSTSYMYFVATDRSGIDTVEADVPSVVNDRQSNTVTVTGTGISSVTVYTLAGAQATAPVVMQSDRAVVSTSALAPGVYFVKVVSAAGTTTEKIIR